MIFFKKIYNICIKGFKHFLPLLSPLLIILFSACEPWSQTKEVSHLSYTPEFEIIGEEFQSFIVVDSTDIEYEDEGALAFSNGAPLKVSWYGEVDFTKVGVYTIVYYAKNSDGIEATAERIIAVRHNDVSGNDLSGKYQGTIWSPIIEMKVTKLHADGFYKCTDIMGYDGAKMTGKFVDLGNHEIYLLHGKGDFGNYAASEGEYTLSSLSWSIGLLDSQYNGLEIAVAWIRVNE